jgi:hypothetical protein
VEGDARITVVITLLLAGAPAGAGPLLLEEDIRTAREILELHYRKTGIYDPVICAVARESAERSWMLCRLVGGLGDLGGLYLIEPGPVIWAVNDRAMQHSRRLHGALLSSGPGSVTIREWQGGLLNIPRALGMFH